MDWQALFNIVLGAFGALAMLMLGVALSELRDLRRNHEQHRTHVAESYVSKVDHAAAMKRIEDLVQKIFDRLDDKADKP